MTQLIQNSSDLLNYLVSQANQSDRKDWFGFSQQKLLGVSLAHQIASSHADKFSPEEIVEYVLKLNSLCYKKIVMNQLQ